MHYILFILFLLGASLSFGQAEQVWLNANEGQWEDAISHKIKINSGAFYVLKTGFAFDFHNGGELYAHKKHSKEETSEEEPFRGQYIRMNFQGANWNGSSENFEPSTFYSNYFVGADPSKWKANLYSYKKSVLREVYPGINCILEGGKASLKYTWIVAPNASPEQIVYQFEGASSIALSENGSLIINHIYGSILDSKPIVWQDIDGSKVPVEARFVLMGKSVHYELGEYDPDYPLIIDPSLTFSTFSGSTSDNWGSTATPDPNGNVFGGGVVFGTGLPTTPGVYDNTFNNATAAYPEMDVCIMKFNATGTGLIYSTYLGGASNEFPSSMVCAPNGQLYILGLTSSATFPINLGADNSFGGGSSFTRYGLSFPNGSDIFIARLSASGNALMSSTFYGGSGNDGVNLGPLDYNLGDAYRGEITLDSQGNVYIASSTRSANLVVTGSGSLPGAQAALAVKFNSNLSAVLWSRFAGGSGIEAGTSIQVATTGNVYLVGGTTSSDFFVGAYNGGQSDGFMLELFGVNGAYANGRLIGTGTYDQCYFVQLDPQDNVYVLGQTNSPYTISPGRYGNPNSGLFLRKYSPNLNNILWTTMIGGGAGHVEISPTAFLVSDCYNIYLSGWGGQLNASYGQEPLSSSNGMPVTPDAYQSSTNGSNFYIAVLDPDAINLRYGTYFGNLNSSFNHVDGGTSRFDKNGNIYHAVCAGCGGNSGGFTTTPGVWSNTNNSTNCNLAVFKFELGIINALATVTDPLICDPEPVIFQNFTQNANTYQWDFGDGSNSNVQSPTHQYPGPGSYTVTLIVSDSNNCFLPDTTSLIVDIGDFVGGVVVPTDTICPNQSFQLQASGGTTYLWSPGINLSDSTIANPIAIVDTTTTFKVIISDSCGIDTLFVTLNVFNEFIGTSTNTVVCIGDSYQMTATGGVSYQWTPAIYLSDPNIANPISTPDSTTLYTVLITTDNGCQFVHQILVGVRYDEPIPIMDDTLNLCKYYPSTTVIGGADFYDWSPTVTPSGINDSTFIVFTDSSQYFVCEFTNSCGTREDSIYVWVIEPELRVSNDTTVCLGDTTFFYASGMDSYAWMPDIFLDDPLSDTVRFIANKPVLFEIYGTDIYGCQDTNHLNVGIFASPKVSVNTPPILAYGDQTELRATGSSAGGNFLWTPDFQLSCPTCPITLASPNQSTRYFVEFTDTNGCKAMNQLFLRYEPLLFVPNTFTPDKDNFNEVFSVVYTNLIDFRLDIYNRWGELIHTLTPTDNAWNGQYKGQPCPDGTYNWRMTYTDFRGQVFEKTGHVMILK